MKNRFFTFFFALLLVLASVSAHAADKSGIISRDASLYSKPFKDADVITELTANTAITLLRRKGGWYEIKTTNNQGWVRLTRVRLNRKAGQGTTNDDNSGVGELLSGLATGRGKSSEDTTATAVKGLSEEELRNAEPDEEALDSLDNFAVTDEANTDSGLQTRHIDFQPGTGESPDDTAPKAETTTEEEEE